MVWFLIDKGFILPFVADSTSILLYGELCFFKDTICLLLATAVSHKKKTYITKPVKNMKEEAGFFKEKA